MLNLLKSDPDCIPVDEHPEVIAATGASAPAQAELAAAEVELDRLNRLLRPPDPSATTGPVGSRVDRLMAEAAMPDARRRYFLAEAKAEPLRERLRVAREEAKHALDAAYQEERREWLAELFAKLGGAAEIARRGFERDQRHEAQGGSQLAASWPELLPGALLDYRLEFYRKDGLLD
ncbi:MAG: hypothetical protein E8D45_07865 [Nitrospira sp.]|nr:MAG: hypothetical protein E8D45_07865 [Nitrospira sp.]